MRGLRLPDVGTGADIQYRQAEPAAPGKEVVKVTEKEVVKVTEKEHQGRKIIKKKRRQWR